ncbi:MAG: zinc ribbon domain-containing protein [Angelakisella sp.]|jgi:hypothetical protein|nr:zinc ribbon domain-containing protein [Angelakisella sp.]
MFCGKCGTKNENSASFCKECGAPLAPAEPIHTGGVATVTKDSRKKNKLIGMTAVAVVLAAVLFLVFPSLGGDAPATGAATAEEVGLQFVDAIFTGNGKGLMEGFHPKTRAKGKKLDEIIEKDNKFLSRRQDQITDYYGEGWTFSWEPSGKEELPESELEEIKVLYKSKYNLEVTEAQKVWVSVTVSGAEHENMTRMSAKAIRIGDFWYMYAGSMYTPGLFGS